MGHEVSNRVLDGALVSDVDLIESNINPGVFGKPLCICKSLSEEDVNFSAHHATVIRISYGFIV